MSYIEVEQGKSYYAEVSIQQPDMIVEGVQTPQRPLKVGGTFTIGGGDIKLGLVQFDDYFHVPDGKPVVVRTEANWYASLFGTVPNGSGNRGHSNGTTHYQDMIANTALVGWQPWLPEYRVKRTTFRVPLTDYLLRHWPTYRELADNKVGHRTVREPFSAPIRGGVIRLHYAMSGSVDSNYPKEIWPVLEMEFDEPLTLDAARRQEIALMRFLSCVSSVALETAEQTFSQLSRQERIDAVGRSLMPIDYSVYYYQDRSRQHLSDKAKHVDTHGAFAFLDDDAERDAFVACLTAWFDRYEEWEGAASAMMDALSLDGIMSPTRLLNVTKWIEATPGTTATQAIAPGDVTALASLLSRQAIKMGYKKLRGRLSNSLTQIAQEANSARFDRLVAELKTMFGHEIIGDDLAAWVAEAFSNRGKAAHRPIIRQSQLEYEVFSQATQAAECFAYLMLLRDLPMTKAGRYRAGSARMVQYYRVVVKGETPKDFKKRFKAKEA
jgi:hypothetical protein